MKAIMKEQIRLILAHKDFIQSQAISGERKLIRIQNEEGEILRLHLTEGACISVCGFISWCLGKNIAAYPVEGAEQAYRQAKGNPRAMWGDSEYAKARWIWLAEIYKEL